MTAYEASLCGKECGEANIWGDQRFEKYFFEITLEKGIECFDDYVEALLYHLLVIKQAVDVLYFGTVTGVREDERHIWVGWGGKRSRGEEGVNRQGECQSEHSKVANAQVLSVRDVILVDHVVETTNVLICWMPNDAINCFVVEILHNFFGQSQGHDGSVICL